MSTETPSDATPESDDYGTQDEIYAPFSEEQLKANPPKEVEFDDTEGDTSAIAGHPVTQTPEAFPNEQAAVESQQTEQPADELPVGDATQSGDEPGQEEQAEPEFDAALLASIGMEESQAKAQFGTPEALKNAVRLVDQNAMQIAWQQEQQQLPPEQHQQVDEQGQEQQTNIPGPRSPDEFQLPEPSDGEEWDDDVYSIVEALNSHWSAKLDAVQQELDTQRQHTESFLESQQQEAAIQYVEAFEARVNALGDEWTELLGKGDGREMPIDSPHVQNRLHLDSVTKLIAKGHAAQGRPPRS